MTLSQGSRSDQEALVLDVEEDGSLLLQLYVNIFVFFFFCHHVIDSFLLISIIKFINLLILFKDPTARHSQYPRRTVSSRGEHCEAMW